MLAAHNLKSQKRKKELPLDLFTLNYVNHHCRDTAAVLQKRTTGLKTVVLHGADALSAVV